MRIALDAMGGDDAPAAPVAGAVAAARDLGVRVLLFGDRVLLERELARHDAAGLDLELRHADERIPMDEAPTAALRRRASSLHGALEALRDGAADAVVSAGNTGACMVLAARILGRAAGVERPALAVTLPSASGRTVLLDAGANVESRPRHLAQFAMMGDAYARALGTASSPRVGLLSNGIEEGKGDALVQAALPLLRQLPIEFVGPIEARDLTSGAVDVAVCDGFAGNLVLKALEGFGGLIGSRLREIFRARLRTRLAFLLARRDLDGLRRQLDAGEVGGALLVGIAGVAVKAHGSSDARAIRNAVGVARALAERGVVPSVARGIEATVGLEEGAPRGPRRLWRSLRGRLRREGASANGSAGAPAGGPTPADEGTAADSEPEDDAAAPGAKERGPEGAA